MFPKNLSASFHVNLFSKEIKIILSTYRKCVLLELGLNKLVDQGQRSTIVVVFPSRHRLDNYLTIQSNRSKSARCSWSFYPQVSFLRPVYSFLCIYIQTNLKYFRIWILHRYNWEDSHIRQCPNNYSHWEKNSIMKNF